MPPDVTELVEFVPDMVVDLELLKEVVLAIAQMAAIIFGKSQRRNADIARRMEELLG